MDKQEVTSFWVGDEVADDDPLRVVKLRARQLCDPHYQAGQRTARVDEAAGLFAEFASGSYILPLALDDRILLTSAGAANPWRRVCRTVTATSNTWNGATSAGATAHWYAEGAITSDDTPTLVQLQVTPHRRGVGFSPATSRSLTARWPTTSPR